MVFARLVDRTAHRVAFNRAAAQPCRQGTVVKPRGNGIGVEDHRHSIVNIPAVVVGRLCQNNARFKMFILR